LSLKTASTAVCCHSKQQVQLSVVTQNRKYSCLCHSKQQVQLSLSLKTASTSVVTQNSKYSCLLSHSQEQAQQQPVPNLEDEDGDKPKQDDAVELQDDSAPEEDEIPTKDSEKVSGDKQNKDKSERKNGERVEEGGETEMCVEVEGDKVDTLGAARGSETTFHTALGDIASDASRLELMSAEEHRTMRSLLESQLATWSQVSVKGDVQCHCTFVYKKHSVDTGGVRGWQAGRPPQAPHFRPKVVLIRLSSYILR
jgi:hypothetical protein